MGTGAAARTHDHVQKARVHDIENAQQLSFTIQGNSYLRIHQLLIDLNVKEEFVGKMSLPPSKALTKNDSEERVSFSFYGDGGSNPGP